MRFVSWKWVMFCPPFFLEIRDDVLPCHRTNVFTKQSYRFSYSRFMMPDPTMSHSIPLSTVKLIEPSMHFFIGLAK
jgi:hypothetical protein